MDNQKVVFVAITRSGAILCDKLAVQFPNADFKLMSKVLDHAGGHSNCTAIEGTVKEAVGDVFKAYDQLVFVVSIGAVVRLIAPHLKSKETDPGVIVIDDAGDHVIPILSGHQGGANAFAEKIAVKLAAQVVFTTASEVGKTIAVDILGRELGWEVIAPKVNLVRVAAHVVNKEKVALVQEAGSKNWWTRPTAIPKNIEIFDDLKDVDLSQFKALLWITDQEVPQKMWDELKERLVVYRPPKEKNEIVIGLGCDRGTPAKTISEAVWMALDEIGFDLKQVKALATIDKKSDEVGLLKFAKSVGLDLQFYTTEELAKVKVPNPSKVVMKYMGTGSVAEAAAILVGKGSKEDLVLEKLKHKGNDGKNATVSLLKIK